MENCVLPVMILKGLVLLPNQEVKLDINNKISKKVIMSSSANYNDEIMIVCPLDQKEEQPEVTDLPFVGVLCKITSKIELSNGHLKIKARGIKRVAIKEYSNNVLDIDILECSYKEIILPEFSEAERIASKRKLVQTLKKYIEVNSSVSNSILSTIKSEDDLNAITDQITLFLPFSIEKKLEYMQEINALKRAKSLIKDINVEIEVSLLDEKLDDDLSADLEKEQKEYILKEKIKQIKKELGEDSLKENEISVYRELLSKLDISKKTREKIEYEIKKYEFTNDMSPDASMIRNYLDWIINLPWNITDEEQTDLNKIQAQLDKSHYGLEQVKSRILEYVAVKKRNKDIISPIICLVGPPGVGKTTLAASIAESLNKKFAKISVGGLNDSAELNGHRRTYLGSAPGKIIQSIKKSGSSNPLILIDEVDKMVKDYKGDPASVLLDILDVSQNKEFIDNYIEEPFDLSKVLFVLTANNKDNIPLELLDRLEIIEINSYTLYEKIDIAKKYILPRIFKDYIIKSKDFKISSEVLKTIIENYAKEAGVRELTRVLDKIIRKIILSSNDEDIKVTVNEEDLIKYLGDYKYDKKLPLEYSKSGIVNGLGCNNYGGVVIPIESAMYDGTGKLELTGSLGNIIKESINVAMSYIHANKDDLKINDYYFKNKDFHVHMLDASTKKDGPSAGVSITTSIISLILNKRVNSKIAFTGEISLSGNILQVGGIKEKLIAAYNNGIKIIFIPKENHNDLDKVPEEIKKELNIIEVSNYIEVYNNIFG